MDTLSLSVIHEKKGHSNTGVASKIYAIPRSVPKLKLVLILL